MNNKDKLLELTKPSYMHSTPAFHLLLLEKLDTITNLLKIIVSNTTITPKKESSGGLDISSKKKKTRKLEN